MSSTALVTMQPQTVMDPAKREELVRNLIMPKATNEQISLAQGICDRYGFDILLRHILFISGNLYVTRDGLRHLANCHPQFDGYGKPEFERDEHGKWIATVSVYRKDRAHPFYATAYQAESENPQSPVWRSHPRLMTHKVAEVMALRAAFSVSLGTAEEQGYDGQVTVIAPQAVPPRAVVVDTTPLTERTIEEQAVAIIGYLTKQSRTEQRQREGCAKLFALTDELPLLTDWRNVVLTTCQQEIVDESWQARMTALGRDFSGAWVVEAEAVPTPASYAG